MLANLESLLFYSWFQMSTLYESFSPLLRLLAVRNLYTFGYLLKAPITLMLAEADFPIKPSQIKLIDSLLQFVLG